MYYRNIAFIKSKRKSIRDNKKMCLACKMSTVIIKQ